MKELEKYRTHFFMLGLVIALGVITLLFNWKFYEDEKELEPLPYKQIEAESDIIPITKRQKPKKVAKPVKAPEKIEVVDNLVELDEELNLSITETDESEAVTSKTYVEQENPVAIEKVDVEEETEEEALPFAVVENVPIYPGCDRQLERAKQVACFEAKVLHFVASRVHYPEAARRLNISGRVFVQFVIEKDGRVSNIEVLRGVHPMLDEVAVKAVKELPVMEPANQRGKPVRMKFVLPIKMILQE